MVKPKKTLELHYPMIQFLIKTSIPFFIKRLRKDGFINYKTKQFLIQTDSKPGKFYILLKLH